jgi:hypothetical protein
MIPHTERYPMEDAGTEIRNLWVHFDYANRGVKSHFIELTCKQRADCFRAAIRWENHCNRNLKRGERKFNITKPYRHLFGGPDADDNLQQTG